MLADTCGRPLAAALEIATGEPDVSLTWRLACIPLVGWPTGAPGSLDSGSESDSDSSRAEERRAKSFLRVASVIVALRPRDTGQLQGVEPDVLRLALAALASEILRLTRGLIRLLMLTPLRARKPRAVEINFLVLAEPADLADDAKPTTFLAARALDRSG